LETRCRKETLRYETHDDCCGLLTGLFAPPLFAACEQAAPAGSNLTQQIESAYATTVLDANGLKVTQPGCVLVIQKENIQACTSSKTPYRNVYEDGQVAAETKSKILNKIGRFPGIGGIGGGSGDTPSCTGKPRALMVGEKVYLVRLDVNDQKESGIVFGLQTCGSCDPNAVDPAHIPYRADIRVSFRKGYLAATDLQHIEQTVGEVLAFPENASSGGNAQQSTPAPSTAPPAAPASFAPIAPPPAPADDAAPVAPVNVTLGQTTDQVKAILGNPSSDVKLGKKEIYSYSDKKLKVTFVDGKVSDID
jgi:hypothetical protein